MTASAGLLDAEHERIFREAQRAADTIFTHYQLSQLLATHARSATLAETVLDELVRVCDAARGGIWLHRLPDNELRLVASAGDGPIPSPGHIRTDPEHPWAVVELEEVGLLALEGHGTRAIEADALRFLSLVRHELAGAFRSAQLAETLELERTELAAMIENASDAIVVFDASRRVARANPAAERLFGQGSSSVVGQPCATLHRCEPVDALERCVTCPVARVGERGTALAGEERIIRAGPDEATSVVGSYAPTSTTADGRAGVVAMLRDTSELARLAELRRGFLASVSHELRTPIALIRGYVETLLHLEPDEATARQYVQRINETAGRLGHLVEQILDSTQLAAGQLVLDVQDVDLAALVGEVVDQVTVGAGAPRPSVEVSGPAPMVAADRDRLRQVIENLLGNALKYGNRSPITLKVEASDAVADLRISDGGIGIPADERELVFEQFHRGRNVRERGISGSGLGLAISRRIVEAHGGTLAFSTDSEAGTTAIVRLPAVVTREGPVPSGMALGGKG